MKLTHRLTVFVKPLPNREETKKADTLEKTLAVCDQAKSAMERHVEATLHEYWKWYRSDLVRLRSRCDRQSEGHVVAAVEKELKTCASFENFVSLEEIEFPLCQSVGRLRSKSMRRVSLLRHQLELEMKKFG